MAELDQRIVAGRSAASRATSLSIPTIRARVKPKTTFWIGSPKRVPFAVQVDEPTAGSFQVPATLEQRAIIPGWIKPAAGLLITAIAAVLVLPRMLGLDGASASPSLAAIASTPPPVTAPPPTDTPAPAATEGPTPTPILGPPDTLVAAGDKNLNLQDLVFVQP